MTGWACESAGARIERLRDAVVLVLAAIAGTCRHGERANGNCIECTVPT